MTTILVIGSVFYFATVALLLRFWLESRRREQVGKDTIVTQRETIARKSAELAKVQKERDDLQRKLDALTSMRVIDMTPIRSKQLI